MTAVSFRRREKSLLQTGGRIYAIERKKTGSRRFAGRTEEQFYDLTMLCLEYKGNTEQTQDLPISEIAEE